MPRTLSSLHFNAVFALVALVPATGWRFSLPATGANSRIEKLSNMLKGRQSALRCDTLGSLRTLRMKGGQTTNEDQCKLRVLSVNDVYELDNWPRFRTAVKELTDGPTIVVLAGDFVGPSLLSSYDSAYGMIDCMNRCGIQYVCFGNHESDIPHKDLVARIRESRFKWINTNMQDIDLNGTRTPEYDVIDVEGGGQIRHVGILGLLTDEPDLYRPGAFSGATIQPVVESASKFHDLLVREKGVDVVIPITHQDIQADRSFAEHFTAAAADKENNFPLVVGGHDHETYLESVSGCQIIKTGADVANIGVADIVWPSADSDRVEVSAYLRPITEFKADPGMQAVVAHHTRVLDEMDKAPLFVCDQEGPLTSKGNRLRQTNLCTRICTALRDALGADCCIINAGSIRANKEYPADKPYFTYNDLKAEMPYESDIVVMPIEGKVVQAAVRHSRAAAFEVPPRGVGGFLQTDDRMTFDDESQTLTHIGGEPVEADRKYRVAVQVVTLQGIDSIAPLVEWTKTHPQDLRPGASVEVGRPAKLVLVDYLSKIIWYSIGAMEDLDADRDGFVSREELRRGSERLFGPDVAAVFVENVFHVADADQDGRISREELLRMHFFHSWARQDMDSNGDGMLDRQELEAYAHKVLGAGPDHQKVVDAFLQEIGSSDECKVPLDRVVEWMQENSNHQDFDVGSFRKKTPLDAPSS